MPCSRSFKEHVLAYWKRLIVHFRRKCRWTFSTCLLHLPGIPIIIIYRPRIAIYAWAMTIHASSEWLVTKYMSKFLELLPIHFEVKLASHEDMIILLNSNHGAFCENSSIFVKSIYRRISAGFAIFSLQWPLMVLHWI